MKLVTSFALAIIVVLCAPRQAAAQLDPLLFLKDKKPNVVFMVDTANRMQRDANNVYLDNNTYKKTGAVYEPALGITALNTLSFYRRMYMNLVNTDPVTSGGDRFSADSIQIVGDQDAAYTAFDERTRIAIARRGLAEAVNLNTSVVRFGLMRTRQQNPQFLLPASANAVNWKVNEGPVKILANALQQATTDGASNGKWLITRPTVDSTNGNAGGTSQIVAADAANSNTTVLTDLGASEGAAGSLIPAGRDAINYIDAPVDVMLDDAKTEVTRLVNATTNCCNTVLVLVVGGGRGQSSAGDVAAKASAFLNIGANHRVPIYVIAIAPPAADVASLQSIAANSGGQYTEITPAMITATVAGKPVPEFVRAVNIAVQHAFAAQSDVDTDPTGPLPFGPQTDNQVTSPIVGTVNLENGKDINGVALPNSIITKAGVTIPQHANMMVTSGFALPGFDGKLRAFRVYKPVADVTKPSGYTFSADGTRLWVASTPAAGSRNIYTALPNGTMVAFTTANAATLLPYLYPAALYPAATVADATTLIDFIRSQPLGAIVGSTPAFEDPPSLDPPPDADYPGYLAANKLRRTIIWIGANDGMLHAIDGRLGVEVWAYVPFNLLPKLGTLRSGQPVGDFRFFVDSSAKVADVKIDGAWRTYLVIGEGPGGTFYQTFDVTLPDFALTVSPTDDAIANVLPYFADINHIPLKWSFPKYSDFDVSIAPYGDIAVGAPAIAKTVGETWSDPAIGEIESDTGKFVVLTGSGFFKWSVQQQANRGNIVAGTTFYILDAKTGDVFDSRDVGSDGVAETVDNCVTAGSCLRMKNALHADPVATGPSDSRFITKAYLGDLDGRVWRLDFKLDAALKPTISTLTKLYDAGNTQPLFASMATVTVGQTQQYLFLGTGSDLQPSNGVSQGYKLLGLLDQGATAALKFSIPLATVDGTAPDEKVTAFPAVAGDIVFFTTTLFKPNTPCVAPDAVLYAFTFVGGQAYSGVGNNGGTDAIQTIVGARATAPVAIDQHLTFGFGNKVQVFGDPDDYNNGVGQVGVRILSWREVR